MVILPGAGLATNAIQVELGGSTNKLGENGGYQNLRAAPVWVEMTKKIPKKESFYFQPKSAFSVPKPMSEIESKWFLTQ